ncbi:Conserved_hypothetical protein [Hexamita inflata]|uniref:ubiquitinyl hydrolase 1 n=1 Tax=Hexamita inflata TaxID=28002 RepID=A0AA86NHT3_9EUKA|nr:Conserved hypothetical protein [Hexamita inflata]
MNLFDVSVTANDLFNTINNIFLIRNLPSSAQDSNIGYTIVSMFKDFQKSNYFPDELKQLNTVHYMMQLDGNLAEQLPILMRDLQMSEVIPIYLQAQNCLLFIEKTSDGYYLSSCKVQLDTEYAMKAPFIRQIPQYTYSCSNLNFNENILNQFQELSHKIFPQAQAKAEKGGNETVETREALKPIMVDEILIPQLLTPDSKPVQNKNQIEFLYEDEIRWNNAYAPFRRSGYYLALLMSLHYECKKKFSELGDLYFQLLEVLFMSGFCQFTSDLEGNTLFDVMKITQNKLNEINLKSKTLKIDNNLVSDTQTKVLQKLKEIYQALLYKQNTVFQNECEQTKLIPIAMFGNNDTIINLNDQIQKYLKQSLDPVNVTLNVENKFPFDYIQTQNNQVPTFKVYKNPAAMYMHLFQHQEWVFNSFEAYLNQTQEITKIKKYFEQFYENHIQAFKTINNIFQVSRMLLACSLMICEFDRYCCVQTPILQLYECSLSTQNFEKQLCLKTKQELDILNQVTSYIYQRNFNAKFKSTIISPNIDENSFSTYYARSDAKMQQYILDLIQIDVENVEKKYAQFNLVKNDWNLLMCDVAKMECDNYVNISEGRIIHDRNCKKCALEKQADNMVVSVYEHNLPDNINYRNAIAFEKLAPFHLVVLREIQCVFYSSQSNPNKYKWNTILNFNNYQEKFILSSDYKQYSRSHYSKVGMAFRSQEDCIVANSCNCIFQECVCPDYGQEIIIQIDQNSDYKVLDFAINKTDHEENQIIALQDQCPQQLSKPEFLEFGLLRSGENLQLQNLFRIIKGETLSLNNFETYYLIQMAMNQIGSITEGQRPSMNDYNNEDLILELLEAIKHKIESYQNNWTYNLAVLNLTQIVAKIASIKLDYCQHIQDTIIFILTKIINVNHIWIQEIQCKKSAQLANQLLNISSSTIMCYQIDQQYYNYIINDDNIFKLYSALKVQFENLKIAQNNKNLLNFNQQIINETFITIRKVNSKLNPRQILEAIIKLVSAQWSTSQQLSLSKWKQFGQNQNIYYYNLQDTLIQFDIQFGQFLINGEAQSQLPIKITQNKNFQQLFQQSNVICCKCGQNKYSYADQEKTYFFKQNNDDVYINCEFSNGESYLFIPRHAVTNIKVPYYIIQNYNHWYNNKTQELLFCQGSIEDSEYKYNCVSKQIIRSKQPHLSVIDHSNEVSKSTLKYFNCIEQQEFSLLIYDKDQNLGYIELIRPQLRFYNTKEGFKSVEYENFYVNQYQQIGVFVGLQQKLLLMHKFSNEYIYIVPNGNVSYSKEADTMKVKIDLLYSRSKKVFSIKLNPLFKILQAEESLLAQLYLALLCAVCSSYMPDNFTQISGIEYSVQILKQKCCQGLEPLQKDELNILQELQKLAPIREYYPAHLKVMQKVIYNTNLLEHQQLDMLKIIVQKIIKQRSEFIFLFEQEDKTLLNINTKLIEKTSLTYQYSQKLEIFFNMEHEIKTIQQLDNQNTQINFTNDVINYNMLIGSQNVLQQIDFTQTYEYLKKIKNIWKEKLDFTSLCSQYDIIKEFYQNWLSIYQNIITEQISKQEILTLCCLGLQQGINQQYLNQFTLIHNFRQQFPQIPEHDFYNDIEQNNFNSKTICELLTLLCMKVTDYQKTQKFDGIQYTTYQYTCTPIMTKEYSQWLDKQEQIYEKVALKEIMEVTKLVEQCWPNNIETIQQLQFNGTVLKLKDNQKKEFCCLLQKWKKNYDLHNFFKTLNQLQQQLKEVVIIPQEFNIHTFYQTFIKSQKLTLKDQLRFDSYDFKFKKQENLTETFLQTDSVPFPLVKLENTNLSNQYYLELQKSWDLYHTNITNIEQDKKFNQNIIKQQYIQKMHQLYQQFYFKLQNYYIQMNKKNTTYFDKQFQLYTELQILTQINYSDQNRFQQILDIAIELTYIQQAMRIIKYIDSGPQFYIFAQQESEEPGYTNWNPQEHPLWVLLQIQCDCMIRKKQVEVALEMMSPKSNLNSVMQLNMGEGKTCIIIPMIALELSTKEQLCRLIVLRQVFYVNYIQLKFKLGQLLCRSVLYTQFSRQTRFSSTNIELLSQLYQQCLDKCAILVSQPEYISSYKLKVQESTLINRMDVADVLFKQQQWLDLHVRDILDESDEILSHKYQMIYTIGKQVNITGGNNRWLIIEQVLQCVLKIANDISIKYPESTLCIKHKSQSQYQFMELRFINDKVNQKFIDNIANEVIRGKTEILIPQDLTSPMLLQIEEFLTRDISEEQHKKVISILNEHNCANTFLQLKGLLKQQVLYQALTKRWSVNYGVSATNGKRMAVPFKAKDVASDRTEFGHVDTSLILTLLSYYYTGLTYDMVKKVLVDVEALEDPEAIYSTFIMGSQFESVPKQFREFYGINLKDDQQLQKSVYPVLKYNTRVINFWVNTNVFNKETKQFPQKLTTGAPQLCEKRNLLTTGFSGTNDTKLLLPLSIHQNDLDVLKQTNGEILFRMLQPQNDQYCNISNENVSLQVIQHTIKTKCKVILDVGAVMIEMNNQQIAKKWLSLVNDEKIRAAIFINEQNKIMVVDHHNNETELMLSPFANNLGACIIYIDDIHTRGTDLKIPLQTKACVTLGMGVTKDKLVQGCMRMRQLGKGHSISFVAVSDVNKQIQQLFENQKIGVKQVMQWACNNSINVLKTGLVHWIWTQFHYIEKHYLTQVINSNMDNIENISKHYPDDDIQELMHLYGQYMNNLNAHDISLRIFQIFKHKANLLIDKYNMPIKDDYNAIMNKTEEYGMDITGSIQNLDEQQEREIELEIEQETEKQVKKRAQFVSVMKNQVDKNLIKLFKNDQTYQFSLMQMHLSRIIKKQLPFTSDIFMSSDFANVSDSALILKPVRWILLANGKVYVISSFEANILRDYIEESPFKLIPFQGKYKVTQKNIHTNPKLHLPPANEQLSDNQEQLLLLFAGNLYFENNFEQQKYCKQFNYLPQPRTQLEQTLVDNGLTMNGQLITDDLQFSVADAQFELSAFYWECDYCFSHVYRVVVKGMKVQFE